MFEKLIENIDKAKLNPSSTVKALKASIIRSEETSQPGNPPFGKTGDLVNSIKSRNQSNDKASISMIDYGIYLEIGTSKMAPRPFIVPALNRTKSVVVKDYIRQIFK